MQPEAVQRCVIVVISFEERLIATHSTKNSEPPEYLERGAPFENYFVQLLGCWSEYSSIDPGALFLPAVVGGMRGEARSAPRSLRLQLPCTLLGVTLPYPSLSLTPSPPVCLHRSYSTFSSLVPPSPLPSPINAIVFSCP